MGEKRCVGALAMKGLGGGGGAKVFEPVGEVEGGGGEVAGGDEVEHGVLEVGGEFGEGVVGVGAGEGVEGVEAKLVVGQGEAGAGRGEEIGESLVSGELGWGEVMGALDRALLARAGSALLGDRVQGIGVPGHVETLLWVGMIWTP
jgi:hypothetical protein